jgi:hypothetical protein
MNLHAVKAAAFRYILFDCLFDKVFSYTAIHIDQLRFASVSCAVRIH